MISKVLRIKIQILWLCFACPLLVTEISVYIRIYGSFLLLTVYDVYKHDVGNSSNIFSFMFCTALKFVSILYEDLDRSLFKFIFLFALYQFLLITVLCIWRRKWQPTPVFLPREACGQRSLVGLSIGSHRVRHNWSDLACMHALEKEMAAHSSILAWRIPGTEEPGGLPSMGSHRVGHDWSDLAAAAAANKDRISKCTFDHCHIVYAIFT